MTDAARRRESKFRTPSITLLLGQTNSGKTFSSSYILSNWVDLYDRQFKKLTIIYATPQLLLSSKLRESIPKGVDIVRHSDLQASYLTPEALRADDPDDLACLLLDDQVGCYIRPTSKSNAIHLSVASFPDDQGSDIRGPPPTDRHPLPPLEGA